MNQILQKDYKSIKKKVETRLSRLFPVESPALEICTLDKEKEFLSKRKIPMRISRENQFSIEKGKIVVHVIKINDNF